MTFRTLAVHLAALVVIAASSNRVVAQAPPITAPGASIAVRIAMDTDQVPVGQSPIATLTIWNISNHIVYWQNNYRVHIEGKSGELPKTIWCRRFLHEPGLPDLTTTLNVGPRAIYPADSAGDRIDSKFTLSAFYDLDIPGSYSVYLEAGEESGKLLRTNAVQFEMQAPK